MKQFEAFALDESNACLWRGGMQIALPPKPFAVLRYLVENPGRLVTHDELLDALWPETYVQPQVLRTYVLELRKILGDDAGQPRFIQTQPKRGYRFVAPISHATAAKTGPPVPSPAAQPEPASVARSANGTAAEPAEPATIAVLPLINISPDPENDYICDGLAEELIDGLTQIEGLRVVSRNSSFQFKGATYDVREIGRRLGASLLVHGSVRRSGDQLRLSIQLSQTGEGYQIWSQRFDASTRDLFALQDELTAAVLQKLRKQVGLRFPGLGSKRQAPVSEAYDNYLQGRFAFNQETPAGFREAIEMFTRSATADPKFAPAWNGIAETHTRLDWYGLEPAAESVPAVKGALEAALRLEPNSAAALCNLAITQAGWDWDWTTAGETFKRALASGGGLAAVHFHYGLDYLTPLGRLEEALEELQQALHLDPLSPITNCAVGGCLYRMRLWDEAEEALGAILKSNPGFGHVYWSLGRVLLAQGRHREALKRFEEAAKIMGQIPAALAELGYCHARMGQRELAHCMLQEMQRIANREWVSPLNAALVYAGLGEEKAAILQLEKAFEKRIRQLVWANVDPRYDMVRQNPKFQRLIARLGLPQLEA